MREVVRFTLNGSPVEITAPDPTLTLLDWLRCERRLTGTKEGCAEGDCGACTVMAIDPSGAVRAVNACIAFVPMMDGCALLTVEGLTADGKLSALQRAMVEEHGSQCGFCTPGILMALHAHHAKGGAARGLNEALAGNLCRCTGYGPIIRAGERVCALPKPVIPAPPAPRDDLGYALGMIGGGRRFHAPTTLAELVRLSAKHPDAVILAGATDVGLWVTKQGRRPDTLLSVMRVAELAEISNDKNWLAIGAAVRYADALPALAALHPALDSYVRRIGAAQVRDSGTVVGNIANGSPIGDMPPVLIALGAVIDLAGPVGKRAMPLEQFFLAYGKQDRRPGEIVTRVRIPCPSEATFFAAEKVSKRFEQDISVVSAGFYVELGTDRVAASARLAFGGMAGVPKRAAETEAALIGRPWTESTISAAAAKLADDFQPLSDWRGSAAYRLSTARSLLLRFFHESQSAQPQRVTYLRSVAHG